METRYRQDVRFETDCLLLLRGLERVARRFRVGHDTHFMLGECVTLFGVLLDRLREACGRAGGHKSGGRWVELTEERKLRALRSLYRLSCSFHDEVLSIVAARDRAARGAAPRAWRLIWATPVLNIAGSRAWAVAPRGRVVYAEWRRCDRVFGAGEPLSLSVWEMQGIVRTLGAAGDELLDQARRRIAPRSRARDTTEPAVRLGAPRQHTRPRRQSDIRSVRTIAPGHPRFMSPRDERFRARTAP